MKRSKTTNIKQTNKMQEVKEQTQTTNYAILQRTNLEQQIKIKQQEQHYNEY